MSYINWTKYGIKINLKMGANINNCYTDEPSVLKDPNGTYKMWYSGCNDSLCNRVYYITGKYV